MQATAASLALQPCYSQAYTEAKPARRSRWIRNRSEFGSGFHNRKWWSLSRVMTTASYIRERTLTDQWHFAILVLDESGPRKGSAIQCQTQTPLVWQETQQWSGDDRDFIFSSGPLMFHNQTEKAWQEERQIKWKENMWKSMCRGRERKVWTEL